MKDFNLGDLLSLLIVFFVYLAAASSGKKKKGAKDNQRRSPMRSRAKGERHDPRAAQRDQQTQAGFGAAFSDQKAEQNAWRREAHPEQLHLHDVTQAEYHLAGEGEDPCHAGGVDVQESPFDVLLDDAQQDRLAQDVLRGVVMSEILTRPCERCARTAMQRGRR